MKKVVILGCENSHADQFLRFMRDEKQFADMQAIGVYSDEKAAAEELNKKYGVPVMETYGEAAGKADGVIITARHGDNHYKFAKPYIESGVPMFVDKPITVKEKDALEFMRECRERKIALCGGSSCKHADFVKELKRDAESGFDGKTLGGYLRLPIRMENPNGGFFFYAQHLAEVAGEIFGKYPRSVKAYPCGGLITVIFRYEEYDIEGLYVEANHSCYYAARVSETQVKGAAFDMFADAPYICELEEFHSLLHGGAGANYADFISPVFLMNAIKYSLTTGREVEVKKIYL